MARTVPVGTEALQSFFSAPAGIASGEKSGLSCIGIHHPWRERKQDSQARRRSLVEQPQATTNSFSRITKHETRITAFMLFTNHETRNTNHGLCALFIIVHDCSPLFAIVQQKILSRQAPLATAPVSSRPLPLRPTQDEPMLRMRKGNVRCCDDTFLSRLDTRPGNYLDTYSPVWHTPRARWFSSGYGIVVQTRLWSPRSEVTAPCLKSAGR